MVYQTVWLVQIMEGKTSLFAEACNNLDMSWVYPAVSSWLDRLQRPHLGLGRHLREMPESPVLAPLTELYTLFLRKSLKPIIGNSFLLTVSIILFFCYFGHYPQLLAVT